MKAMVDDVLCDLDLDPQDHCFDTEGGYPSWALMRGSAQVFILFHNPENKSPYPHLQIFSPLLCLPNSVESSAILCYQLLELNASELSGGLAFGIRDKTVVLTASRSIQDLDASEFRSMLLLVGYYADLYDDILADKFGVERYGQP